jgi:hypothetical protein
MSGFVGIADTLLLIALGVGYAVLYLTKREEKGMRLLGYTIGTLIIASAISYMFLNIILQDQLANARAYYSRRMMMQQPRMMPKMSPMKLKR